MKVDYHVHTSRCGHAAGTVEEMVESAIASGFDQVGIADHMPMIYKGDSHLSMTPEELPEYVEEVNAAKEKYRGRIKVLLGIEADYHAPTQPERMELLGRFDFDYVIGSVHILGDWIFDSPLDVARYEGLDLDEFYAEYLSEVRALVETGEYDIVGHLDLAKKFDKRPLMDLSPYYLEILRAMKERGTCFEVNTAGLRWPAGEIYPEPAFVRMAAGMSVPVTMGSDAHSPGEIGKDFDKAEDLLAGAGYESVATFEERRMTPARLG